MQNCDFWIRFTSFCGSQASPVDFWMQKIVLRSRMTLVYWSQPSSVVYACKTAPFGSELQVSMGPRLRLLICECKIMCLHPEWRLSISPRPHLCFFCIHNSVFSSRIASLYGSQLSSVVLCIHNRDIMTRISSLSGSQTSPVVLCMQNNVISIRITSLYGAQPSFVVFACKTASLVPELQVSMGPTPHICFLHSKQRL